MQRDKQNWSVGVLEYRSNASTAPSLLHPITPRRRKRALGFALYEVLIGVTIFLFGVVALGRAVENCIHAGALSAEEERIRQILADRMAIVQTKPGRPDESKEFKIDTGYGPVKLVQKAEPARLEEEEGPELLNIFLVTLTVQWERGGASQSRRIEFYVYRPT